MRIRETARVLWLIYMSLTVAEVLALRVCGVSWFDSFCHTFSTLATGGFSTRNASFGGDYGAVVHVVVIIFMVLIL